MVKEVEVQVTHQFLVLRFLQTELRLMGKDAHHHWNYPVNLCFLVGYLSPLVHPGL